VAPKIERIDTIPLIIASLEKMNVQKTVDSIFIAHGNWTGLSYGQLTVLFVTYVMHSLTHHFSGMEPWANQHKTVIERVTGWSVGEKDTTAFNMYHDPENSKNGVLAFGHSKDHRPDLLQFKQGLATLDPAGVPILSETLAGNRADDPCYFPAWQGMVKTIGHPNFLFIADCKAASHETRAAIDHEKGYYLFPLPMTGDTPQHIKVLRLPKRIKGLMVMLTIALQALTLMEFVVRRELSKTDEPIAGLVPGNPKRKTKRPTVERLLSQFGSLHFLIEEKGGRISGVVVEELTALQKRILSLLELPEKTYDLSFMVGKKELGVQK